MLAGFLEKIVTSVFVEVDDKENFEISCTDTDVSQDIWVVTGVQNYDCLNVCWNFFLTGDLLDKENRSLGIGLVHNIPQDWHSFNIASATMCSTLTDDEPVAEMSTVSNMRINLFQNHGQTEEQCSSQCLLREKSNSIVLGLEMSSHHLSFLLHDFGKDIIDLSKSLLESVDDTLDLSGVVLIHVFRVHPSKDFPVISAVF